MEAGTLTKELKAYGRRLCILAHHVPGYSAVRWYSTAEIQFTIAENFDKLQPFLDELNNRNYGEATRAKLDAILAQSKSALQLELAAMLDLHMVKTTYELEGDRLA